MSEVSLWSAHGLSLQGYLAHQKQRPPGTLKWKYAEGPIVVVGRGAVSYARGTPSQGCLTRNESRAPP